MVEAVPATETVASGRRGALPDLDLTRVLRCNADRGAIAVDADIDDVLPEGRGRGGVRLRLRPHAAGRLRRGLGTNAAFDDYRALVCVFLFGGNDSFNMVVPRSNAEYDEYAACAPEPRDRAVEPAADQSADLRTVRSTACIRRCPGRRAVRAGHRLAIVANVGPLIEPTTKAQFLASIGALPPQLFSHNDQQDQWHVAERRGHARTGWGGRIADVIRAPTVPTPLDQPLAVNLSLSGQRCSSRRDVRALRDGPRRARHLCGLDGDGHPVHARRAALRCA